MSLKVVLVKFNFVFGDSVQIPLVSYFSVCLKPFPIFRRYRTFSLLWTRNPCAYFRITQRELFYEKISLTILFGLTMNRFRSDAVSSRGISQNFDAVVRILFQTLQDGLSRSSEFRIFRVLVEPRFRRSVNDFVAFDDAVGEPPRRRNPGNSDCLRRQRGASCSLWRSFWYTFRSVRFHFFRCRSAADFVERLHHHGILCVSFQIRNL